MTIRFLAAGTLALGMLGAAATAFPAGAGVIRDDRSDQDYLDLGASSAYQSVGYVQGNTASYGFSASGVLIGSSGGSSWILTAGHVTQDATDLTIKLGGTTYQAADWFSHSKWNGDLARGYDIGMMRIATSITDITPALLHEGTDEIGKMAVMAGYGTTGTGSTGWTSFDGRKRAGQNMVDIFLNTGGKPGKSRVLLADFDNPRDPNDSSWGSPDPLDLEYMIAPGDSGGGLFIGGLLAGITSFGWGRLDGDPNSDYGDAGGFTRVSMFVDWIMEAMGLSSGGDGSGGGGGKGGNKGKKPNGLMAYPYIEVPEPGTMTLLAVGFAGIGFARRRRASA